ncbi:MAG: undecaprenyl-diphosphatase [Colwellia sp.]|jgi:undecaprenyl-diphosphatase
MLKKLIQLDTEFFLFLNGWGSPTWDSFWLLLSEKWIGLPLVIIFLYGALLQLGPKKTAISIVFIGLIILCSDQLANLFKEGLARPRPCFEPQLEGMLRLIKSKCGGAYGFFSAHAANSMGIAIFMASLLKNKWKWFVFPSVGLALLIGYSRIYIGVHYPLDVLFGFGVGAFFAFLGQQIFKAQILLIPLKFKGL